MDDERFILSGWEKKASLQRKADWKSGIDRGYLFVTPTSRTYYATVYATGTRNQHTHFKLGIIA